MGLCWFHTPLLLRPKEVLRLKGVPLGVVLPQAKPAYGEKQPQPASRSVPLAGEKLYLNLNVINYFTCKIILVLFSTNFILAFFATFCGGKS